MAISAGKYIIETEQVARKGKIWNVRVKKKGLFKRLVSSDWFLDDGQAAEFAQQTADALNKNSNIDALAKRKPGWTLHRPDR